MLDRFPGRTLKKEPKSVAHSVKPTVAKKTKMSKSKTISGPQIKILHALGRFKGAGMENPTREQVQILSGNGRTLEGYKKNCGILKKDGYISYPSKDTLELTEKGSQFAGDEATTTDFEWHELLKELIGVKQATEIFELLSDGAERTKEFVVRELKLDPKRLSGFEKNLSKMNKMGILKKTKTTVQLTPYCFISRRP